MGIRKLNRSEVKFTVGPRKKWEALPEWRDLWVVLQDGLKPYEVVEVVLSAATVQRLSVKHPYGSFSEGLRREFERLQLTHLEIRRVAINLEGERLYVVCKGVENG